METAKLSTTHRHQDWPGRNGPESHKTQLQSTPHSQQYCQQQTATLLTTNSNTVNNKQQHCQQQTATLLTTNSNTHCQHQTTSYSVTSNNKHVTLTLATTNTLLCHWQHKHVTLLLATTNMLL